VTKLFDEIQQLHDLNTEDILELQKKLLARVSDGKCDVLCCYTTLV